jgi:hypothetical protein
MEEPARVVGAISVKVSGLEQFKKPGTQVIVYPKDFASGQLLLPYSERR